MITSVNSISCCRCTRKSFVIRKCAAPSSSRSFLQASDPRHYHSTIKGYGCGSQRFFQNLCITYSSQMGNHLLMGWSLSPLHPLQQDAETIAKQLCLDMVPARLMFRMMTIMFCRPFDDNVLAISYRMPGMSEFTIAQRIDCFSVSLPSVMMSQLKFAKMSNTKSCTAWPQPVHPYQNLCTIQRVPSPCQHQIPLKLSSHNLLDTFIFQFH